MDCVALLNRRCPLSLNSRGFKMQNVCHTALISDIGSYINTYAYSLTLDFRWRLMSLPSSPPGAAAAAPSTTGSSLAPHLDLFLGACDDGGSSSEAAPLAPTIVSCVPPLSYVSLPTVRAPPRRHARVPPRPGSYLSHRPPFWSSNKQWFRKNKQNWFD